MATTVTYESALKSLRSMFGAVDEEIIVMVLQQNQGHLERTVEQLLIMTEGGGTGGLGAGGGPPPPSSSSSYPGRKGSSPQPVQQRGGAESALPDDFLRPPSYYRVNTGSSGRSGSSQSQIEQDAILAQMLQDELFMEEIRANPDFYNEEPMQPIQGGIQPIQGGIHTHPSQQYPATSSYAQQAQLHPAPHPPLYQPSSSSAVPLPYQPPTGGLSSDTHQPIVSARGDFTGVGSGAVITHHKSMSQAFRERWASLTTSARQKLLAVAGRGNTKKRSGEELGSQLLSDDELNKGPKGSSALGLNNVNLSLNDDGPASPPFHSSSRDESRNTYVNDDLYENDSEPTASSGGYIPPQVSSAADDRKAKTKLRGNIEASDADFDD